MILSFPHVAFCVGDIEAATRFYVEGFGFERAEGGEPEGAGELIGIPGAKIRTQFLTHPQGPRMELWTVEGGEIEGDRDPTPANRRGRANLCFVVDSLVQAIASAVEYGGREVDGARRDMGYADVAFVTDPEGLRIELVETKGDWPGYERQATPAKA